MAKTPQIGRSIPAAGSPTGSRSDSVAPVITVAPDRSIPAAGIGRDGKHPRGRAAVEQIINDGRAEILPEPLTFASDPAPDHSTRLRLVTGVWIDGKHCAPVFDPETTRLLAEQNDLLREILAQLRGGTHNG